MADPISHVPYDRLVEYAVSSLEATKAGEVQAHLANCPICRATVKRLLALHEQLRVSEDHRPPESVLARAKAIAKSEPASQSAQARGRLTRLAGSLSRLSLALTLMIFAVMAMGTRSLVEQSSGALSGDRLYSVKRAAERVALATTWSDVGRAKMYVGLIRTRINEILALTAAGRYEDVAASVRDLRFEIDDTAVAFRAVNTHDVPAGIVLVQQVEQNLNDSAQKFSVLALAGPPGALPILRSAVEASVSGQTVVRAQLPADTQRALALSAPPPTLAPIAATALASTSIPDPTFTPSETRNPTLTASVTPTTRRTPTATSSSEATATSPTPLESATVAPGVTAVGSPTATPHSSATPSQAITATPVATGTPTPASSATPTPSSTMSDTPSETATSRPTDTDTPLPTASNTPTATDTHTPAPTDTPVLTDTPLPTDTPAPTDTPVPTDTPPPTDTPAPTDTTVPTDTPLPTDTSVSYSASPTPDDTPLPTDTSVSYSASPTPDDTPASVPTWLATTYPPGMAQTPEPTQESISTVHVVVTAVARYPAY